MYFVTGVHQPLCRFFRNTLDVCIENWGKFNHCYWCEPEWFPFLYWMVFVFNVIGLVTSAGKFCDIIWHARIYNVLDGKSPTRVRMVGSIIQLSSYIFLFLGQLTLNPMLMSPWIVIRAIALACNIIRWIYEIRVGQISFRWQELLRFSLSFSFFVCVHCVHSVFIDAIDDHQEDFVALFMGAK